MLCAQCASAQTVTLGKVGQWEASGTAGDGNATCAVSAFDDGQSLIFSAQMSAPTVVKIHLVGPAWATPTGSTAAVNMTFPGGQPQHLVGNGDAIGLVITLGQGQLAPWLHEFTLRSSMTITADAGVSPGWTLNLTGTTPMVTAMSECTKFYNFRSLPAPFVASVNALLAPTTSMPPPVLPPPVAAPIPPPAPAVDPELSCLSASREDITGLVEQSPFGMTVHLKVLDILSINRRENYNGTDYCFVSMVTNGGDRTVSFHLARKGGKIYLIGGPIE